MLRLEIESFYLFAKILLDRLADAFAYYFGEHFGGLGSTYTKLAKRFPEVATRRKLREQSAQRLPDLSDDMQALKRDVVDYRTSGSSTS